MKNYQYMPNPMGWIHWKEIEKLQANADSQVFSLTQEGSMSTETYREFANIGLTPIGSLENTATVLGDILGVTFKKDNEGTYDKYPAFLASTPPLKYGSSRNPGKHRNKNADLIDDVRASKHI
ncbi:hypothetical protein C4K04_0246 [Pseudomonas chlororaphis]|uniref:Uncharacterized protein n=1 Tax=Pseudomonas chlororaphis TaxID=587753 RepID=A0A3G7TFS9_9PSED|nr:hypothetical protein C4K04_0246 [Pseudomonas chlororaphis]